VLRFYCFLMTIAAGAAAFAAPARASEDVAEIWFNPSAVIELDGNTALELETAQRFRDASKGADTYFARLWIVQDISDAVSIGGAVERRINDGAANETRLLQQLNARAGILRGRLRLEQRFVDHADQTAWRIRPRGGVDIPLDTDKSWRVYADAEALFTLRAVRAGGQTGLTGARTQLGIIHAVSDRIDLSLTYLRNQDIIDGRPDRVAHAPLIGLEWSF
jgi:hypothetical protein